MTARRSTLLGGVLLAAAMGAATILPANATVTGNTATPLTSQCTTYVNEGVHWLSEVGHPTSSRTPSTIVSLIKKQLPYWRGSAAAQGQSIINGINAYC